MPCVTGGRFFCLSFTPDGLTLSCGVRDRDSMSCVIPGRFCCPACVGDCGGVMGSYTTAGTSAWKWYCLGPALCRCSGRVCAESGTGHVQTVRTFKTIQDVRTWTSTIPKASGCLDSPPPPFASACSVRVGVSWWVWMCVGG